MSGPTSDTTAVQGRVETVSGVSAFHPAVLSRVTHAENLCETHSFVVNYVECRLSREQGLAAVTESVTAWVTDNGAHNGDVRELPCPDGHVGVVVTLVLGAANNGEPWTWSARAGSWYETLGLAFKPVTRRIHPQRDGLASVTAIHRS